MYHLTQSKQGISSIELGRRLDVTQTTAGTGKHKLAQVIMERDARILPRLRLAWRHAGYTGGEALPLKTMLDPALPEVTVKSVVA